MFDNAHEPDPEMKQPDDQGDVDPPPLPRETRASLGIPGERSVWNPNAVRGPSDVWNETVLDITDWEEPCARIVLPVRLQVAAGISTPVLGWDRQKYKQVLIDHTRDTHVIRNLSRYLDQWEYTGTERHTGNTRVLFRDTSGRWYAFSMGELQGSMNAITIAGSSRQSFLKNRLGGLDRILERNE